MIRRESIMRRTIILTAILAVLILGCGCLQNPGQHQETPPINSSERALQAVRFFMNDTGYNPPMENLSVRDGLLVFGSENISYAVDPSQEKVVRAAFLGRDAVQVVEGTPHYEKALGGIRTFLEAPGFDYRFTEFTFESDRYGLSSANISFRVNATSGIVTSARLQGPEVESALRNSTSYQNAQEAAVDGNLTGMVD